MVNNELDYKVGGDNEDKEQRPYPGDKVDSQKNASEQAINCSPGERGPIPVPEMVDS